MLWPVNRAALPCFCLWMSSVLGGAGVALPAFAQPTPARALPPLPSEGVAGAVPAAPTAQQAFERVRRGVVAIEKAGAFAAVGTVLVGDGRILTALSNLGGSDSADVRYADGTTVHTKVGVSDRVLDLALLVPQSGHWPDGLSASDSDPQGADLRAMLPDRGAHLGPAQAGIKGQVDAHARTGEPLFHLFDVDLKGSPVAGAPLLDSTGSVVAVLVRACKGPTRPAQTCLPVVLGAPISTVRSFLSRAAPPGKAPASWLGIRGEAQADGNVRGVRVVAVAPSSPAEKAALKPGDVVVASDGEPIDSPETLGKSIGRHAAGERVKLLVFGGGAFREVAVELRPAP
jgi:serine protease Do